MARLYALEQTALPNRARSCSFAADFILTRHALARRNPPLTSTIACLGPAGSFSHLVTAQRFPQNPLQMIPSVSEIFELPRREP